MYSELLQVEMGKRDRKGWRGFYTSLTQKRAVIALRPRISGKTLETSGSPETPGITRELQPPKVSTQDIKPVKVLVQMCLS
jgi:hypothetical protein